GGTVSLAAVSNAAHVNWTIVTLLLLASVPGQPDCRAQVFVLDDLARQPRIASPGGSHAVVLSARPDDEQSGGIRVFAGEAPVAAFSWTHLSAGIFVNWAPDSRAFYVMWSSGGAVGRYRVRAFRVADQAVSELPLTGRADRDFDSRHPCPARGHSI